MTEQDIYQNAIRLWGADAQIDMMIEECAELIHAIHKYRRHRIPKDELVQELADVEIMSHQMRLLFGNEEIETSKAYKLMRLRGRIERTIKERA